MPADATWLAKVSDNDRIQIQRAMFRCMFSYR